MINVHRICSWHRDNEQEQKIDDTEVKINRDKIQKNLSIAIDESLAYFLPEKLTISNWKSVFEMLYQLNRLF